MAVVDNAGGITATAAGIQMGGLKVTGLAAGTANGDAMRFEQIPIVGGVMFPSCNTHTRIFEDYTLITAALSNANVTPAGLVAVISGSAAATALLASTATERGLLQYQTGTTGTGSAGVLFGGGNNKSILVQQSDAVYLSTRRRIPTLSDGTNTFSTIFGLSDSSTAVGTNAVVITSDPALDATHWVANIKLAGVNNLIVSTVTITAGQLYVLELVKLAGSTTWTFYIDGTAIGTFAGIPAVTMCGVDYIIKSLGATSRSMDVDWDEWQFLEPSKRASGFLA